MLVKFFYEFYVPPPSSAIIIAKNYFSHIFEEFVVFLCIVYFVSRFGFSLKKKWFLSGVGSFLKSKNPNVKVILADPEVFILLCF